MAKSEGVVCNCVITGRVCIAPHLLGVPTSDMFLVHFCSHQVKMLTYLVK